VVKGAELHNSVKEGREEAISNSVVDTVPEDTPATKEKDTVKRVFGFKYTDLQSIRRGGDLMWSDKQSARKATGYKGISHSGQVVSC